MKKFSLVVVVMLAAVGAWLLHDAWQSAPAPESDRAGVSEPPTSSSVATPETTRVAADDVPAPTRSTASAAHVRGRVVDEFDAPVVDAVVWVLLDTAVARARYLARAAQDPTAAADGARAEVTPDGRFSIPAPARSRPLLLYAHARGRVPAKQRLDPIDAADCDVGKVVLRRAITISGRVVDSNGNGVVGARVRATTRRDGPAPVFDFSTILDFGRRERETPRSDAGGTFTLSLAEPGAYDVVATHDAHPTGTAAVEVERPGQQLDGVVVAMPPAQAVTGRVLDAPAGAPLTVSARAQRAQRGTQFLEMLGGSDALSGARELRRAAVASDGTFTLPGLPPDRELELVLFDGDGSAPARKPACQSVAVVAPRRDVELRYLAPRRLSMRVVDANTGTGLPAVDVRVTFIRAVRILGTVAPSRTDEPEHTLATQDGKLALALRPHPKDTAVQLRIAAYGHRLHTSAELPLDAHAELDLGTIALAAAPTLALRVIDATTREPVPDVAVRLLARTPAPAGPRIRHEVTLAGDEKRADVPEGMTVLARTETDGDGRARLTFAQAPPVELHADARDYVPARVEFTDLPPIGGVEREVALQAGGDVRVSVRDQRGRPVPGIDVEHRDAHGASSKHACDAKGDVRVAHLTPGEHSFRGVERPAPGRPTTPASDDDWYPIRVVEGRTEDLLLLQPTRATVHGTVTDRGRPLRGVVVELTTPALSIEEQVRAALARGLLGAFGADEALQTDREGRYRLEGIGLGDHALIFRLRGRPPVTMPITVVDGDNRCDLALASTSVRGIVVDQGGAPIVGAEVRIQVAGDDADTASEGLTRAVAAALANDDAERTAPAAVTGPDGRFALVSVPSGRSIVVTAHSKEHVAGASAAIVVAAEDAGHDLRIALQAAGRVRLRSTRPEAVAAVLEPVGEGAARAARVAAFADGMAELAGVPPGAWRARAGDRTAVVEVVAGQTVVVDL